ncbi:MAG TPA: SirB2 family protein [Mizugakiibacter sp.]
MALVYFYPQIKLLHIWCVALSGTLFLFRGSLRMAGIGFANHPALRYLSYLIDTTLLTAALLLVVYVVLGTLALKRGRTPRARAVAFASALAVYAFIISVAIAHDARGVFALLS